MLFGQKTKISQQAEVTECILFLPYLLGQTLHSQTFSEAQTQSLVIFICATIHIILPQRQFHYLIFTT